MNIPLYLVGGLVSVACGVLGLILFFISKKKNPKSTLKTAREMFIGIYGGAVGAFGLLVAENFGTNMLVFVFGALLFLCVLFFALGILSWVIVHFFEGEAR